VHDDTTQDRCAPFAADSGDACYHFAVDQQNIPSTIFRPYKQFITISIGGRKFRVPENQMLLRVFQYLAPETIPYGRYCWNEECQYCRVGIQRPGDERQSQALSCKLIAEDGLEVLELSTELAWNLRPLLASPGDNAPGEPPPEPCKAGTASEEPTESGS